MNIEMTTTNKRTCKNCMCCTNNFCSADAVIVNPNDIACSGYTPNEYGEWECTEISKNGSVYLCTNCGKSITTNKNINTIEVCPHCGAEMFTKEK